MVFQRFELERFGGQNVDYIKNETAALNHSYHIHFRSKHL